MTYPIEADSLAMLIKKAQVVIESLEKCSNEWQYVSCQKIEDVEKLAYKNVNGKYKVMLHFFQIPNLQNNYHGMLSAYEHQANYSRRVV